MVCRTIRIPDNHGGVVNAIVCGPRPKRKKCKVCGQLGARWECDWKVGSTRSADGAIGVFTCDKLLCDRCTTKPAPGKDLCREHAEAWGEHLAGVHKS